MAEVHSKRQAWGGQPASGCRNRCPSERNPFGRSARFGLALVVVTAFGVLTIGAGPGVAGATGTTTPQSAIAAGESQVTAIEAQITHQQSVLDQTDEQYNETEVDLASTRAALQSLGTTMATAKSQLAVDEAELRSDAVTAYIDNTTSAAVARMFASPTTASQVQTQYQNVGSSTVAADVRRVQAGRQRLDATRARLLAEEATDTAQLASAKQAAQTAASVTAQSEATLTSVKGALAGQIAQQAAAQAAAAAATAETATNAAAARAAAARASQAAQVASTVSNGSPAAVAANGSANQAASSASGGSGSGTTVSTSGGYQTAGLTAVQAAMGYLGVPYVFGGESAQGVDCSGLTALAWAAAGVSMDHSAADQYAEFPHVSLSALEPGDLLFYDEPGEIGIQHVVMYVGPYLNGSPTPYGTGTIIQAAHTGTVVSLDPLWTEGLVGASRP